MTAEVQNLTLYQDNHVSDDCSCQLYIKSLFLIIDGGTKDMYSQGESNGFRLGKVQPLTNGYDLHQFVRGKPWSVKKEVGNRLRLTFHSGGYEKTVLY